MKVSVNKIQPYIDKKLISKSKHPDFDLWIYKYTRGCQFEGAWDEITITCRGLILDSEGNVIARPLDKFFNLEEKPELIPKDISFVAYDKIDCSCGILYKTPDNKLHIANPSSFKTDRALEGTKILQPYLDSKVVKNILSKLCDTHTLMFEIVYPEARIVVNYGDQRKLVFLCAREIESGKVIPGREFEELKGIFETPKEIKDWEKPRDNSEGVVLYYKNGFMAKAKYGEYVRLHRILTGFTARRIWDMLKNGEDTDEILQRTPEEFQDWFKITRGKIDFSFMAIEEVCTSAYLRAKDMITRKEQALFVQTYPKEYWGVIFLMIDGKSYDEGIWKLIKPAHETPFKENDE